MTKYYYHKNNQALFRRAGRTAGLGLFLLGIVGLLYFFWPLLSWEIWFRPALADAKITTPIPMLSVLSSTTLPSIIKNSVQELSQSNSSDASTWFPNYVPTIVQKTTHHVFFMSIPKLGITNAVVSNADNDLDKHLVNFGGTAFPPEHGNTVVFGHSTLQAWFDPHNYKAIFATLHTMQVGDKIIASDNGVSYTYIIDRISVVNADDTSPLNQQYDDSYLTVITCTPPGTTIDRLVLHARLAKLS